MAFVNRIRLPFKISKPQFIEESEKYRKANGAIETLSVVIRKQYDGVTDHWPEKMHERFKIALAHDTVSIEGERYIGGVSQEGDYQIEWPDFLDYPLGRGTFKVNATPFNASNANCGTCEDFIQVVANDDNLGTLQEGEAYDIDILENDEVCCYPATISIVTFDSEWLQSVVVNPDSTLGIELKTPLPTQSDVQLITYRVQCENGQYDEASVFANIEGSIEVCQAPSVFILAPSLDSDSVTYRIVYNGSEPAGGFEWELRQGVTIVESGTIPDSDPPPLGSFLVLSGLEPSTTYTLYVRSVCGEDDFSNYVQRTFTTDPPPDTESCGRYRLNMDDGSGNPSHISIVQYSDCNGEEQFQVINNMSSEIICALQSSPGNPVFMNSGNPAVTISYLGLC